MGKTKIEWADRVWNPTVGCTPASTGCAHCYAKRIYERFYQVKPFTQIQLHPERLEAPLHWRNPSRVFVNSVSDLFHEDVPDKFIDQVFGMMALSRKHTFMVLTKRPERMNAWFKDIGGTTRRDWAFSTAGCLLNLNRLSFPAWPLSNVWLGVTVENQATATERIPWLLETPAAKRFVSVEPLLGPVDISEYLWEKDSRDYGIDGPALDWVICGGETGPGARPMHFDWPFSLLHQCKDADVPFFFKSWGEYKFEPVDGQYVPKKVGKKTSGRLLDGREWNEFPEVKS